LKTNNRIKLLLQLNKKQMDAACCLLLFGVVAAGGESCIDTCSIKEYNGHHEEYNVAENQHGHRSVQISQKRFTSFILKIIINLLINFFFKLNKR